MRRSFNQPIPFDELPTRLDSAENVKDWHVGRVILDSQTFIEAAERLGVSPKTLWEWRESSRLRDILPLGMKKDMRGRGKVYLSRADIEMAIASTNTNKDAAALLGINKDTFLKNRRKYGILSQQERAKTSQCNSAQST